MSNEYPLQEETYQILGACFEVLNATGIQVALLVNFGHHPKLEYAPFVKQKKAARR